MKTVTYFAHDLSDPIVHRRVNMFTAGGASVTPMGFHRSDNPVHSIAGIPTISLGQTNDGRLASRAMSVAKALLTLSKHAHLLRHSDAIVARNLEMLPLAARARRLYAPRAHAIFECLDIHRLLLSKGLGGSLLRLVETRLWRDLDLLLTSSPAFIEHYFLRRNFPAPIRLLENKLLLIDERPPRDYHPRRAGPPWRIGWFGVIRCKKSLSILSNIARETQGAVEIVIRGRPTDSIFSDFQAIVEGLPYVRFDGPYSAADLPALYDEVHFAWAVDYFEQDGNSAWLLPNRIYEGTFFGAVPIAVAEVETGNWLQRRGIGVRFDEPLTDGLLEFFRRLNQTSYDSLANGVSAVSRKDLAFDRTDCLELVGALCGQKA